MKSEEKKVTEIIQMLNPALETKNQEQIKKANDLIDTVDATKVNQELLNDLNDLFEHEHYKLPE